MLITFSPPEDAVFLLHLAAKPPHPVPSPDPEQPEVSGPIPSIPGY